MYLIQQVLCVHNHTGSINHTLFWCSEKYGTNPKYRASLVMFCNGVFFLRQSADKEYFCFFSVQLKVFVEIKIKAK